MGTNDMLQRAITYEEAILRNYRQYATQAEATDGRTLFPAGPGKSDAHRKAKSHAETILQTLRFPPQTSQVVGKKHALNNFTGRFFTGRFLQAGHK